MSRVAVIGSRGFKRPDIIDQFIRELPNGTVVVSGGARGVDTLAVQYAAERGLAIDLVPAEWDEHGKLAGKLRNFPLVGNADEVYAFWDGFSNGTAHGVTAAVAYAKPVKVVLCPWVNP